MMTSTVVSFFFLVVLGAVAYRFRGGGFIENKDHGGKIGNFIGRMTWAAFQTIALFTLAPTTPSWLLMMTFGLAYVAVGFVGHAAHQDLGTQDTDLGGDSREIVTKWLPKIRDRKTTDLIGLSIIGAVRGLLPALPLIPIAPWAVVVSTLAFTVSHPVGYLSGHKLPKSSYGRNYIERSEPIIGGLYGLGVWIGVLVL